MVVDHSSENSFIAVDGIGKFQYNKSKRLAMMYNHHS